MARDVELVLLQQLSSCLAIPMFVVGPEGDLLFYNESAEPLVGRRFEESGELTPQEWGELLHATDETGRRLGDDERPVLAALRRQEPVHRHLYLRGLDGERREVEGTAVPLVGDHGKMLGVLALYWQPGSGKLAKPAAPPASGDLIQYEIETILMRQLAGYLATPIYIVGAEGQLLYFNAAAERVLGRRFDEIRVSSRDDLYETFRPSLEDGSPLKRGANPLTLARERREPAHLRFCLRTDGGLRTIEGTAFPLIGQSNRVLGAVGIFWEIENS